MGTDDRFGNINAYDSIWSFVIIFVIFILAFIIVYIFIYKFLNRDKNRNRFTSQGRETYNEKSQYPNRQIGPLQVKDEGWQGQNVDFPIQKMQPRSAISPDNPANPQKTVCEKSSHVNLPEKLPKQISPFSEFLDNYNASAESGNFGDFKRKYKAVSIFMGLQNAIEYMNDRSITPIFVHKDDGKFYGVTIGSYIYVVPKPGITLVEIDFGPGAFSKVFDCPGFDINKKYQHVAVAKPAIFTSSGTQFIQNSLGSLNLGKGEAR